MKFLLSVFLCLNALANLELAPKSFKFSKNRKAVFMDIKEAAYDITYHTFWRRASVVSTITFTTAEAGYPIFDLVPRVRGIYLNGRKVRSKKIRLPHRAGKARVIKKYLKPGTYKVTIFHKMRKLARFGVKFGIFKRTVNSGFFIRDLTSRKFLEQFLPTNLEFDQYPMTFNIKVKGSRRSHQVVANGDVKVASKNHFQVTYPNHFTASSVYFHIFPKGKYPYKSGELTSITGRKIPLYVYARNYRSPSIFYKEAQKVFKELERDYGPYGHKSLIIFATGFRGGMEFSGAMTTTLGSLDHELLHSYFAKGVMPANGNSGWLDEAIASWRDYGYQRKEKPSYARTNIGNRSPYARNTDDRSYKVGRSFMAYLDFKLAPSGGLKPHLRAFFDKYNHKVITTQMFINFLTISSGVNLQSDFNYFILNTVSDNKKGMKSHNHIHGGYSSKQLDSILGE
jgi:hypothetical protein